MPRDPSVDIFNLKTKQDYSLIFKINPHGKKAPYIFFKLLYF